MVRVPPRRSMSHSRPGIDPMCQYSQALVIIGTGDGSGISKSATHSLAPNGSGVLHWSFRRMLQVIVNGSQKNSPSVRPSQARVRVKYSIRYISSSRVPARFPVMSRIVLGRGLTDPGISPGPGWRAVVAAVTAEGLGPVLVPAGGAAVGVQHDGPAVAVDL